MKTAELDKFIFFHAHFGNIDMKVADGISGEFFLGGFLTFHLQQVADAVALERQCSDDRSSQAGNTALQGVKAVIQASNKDMIAYDAPPV